MIYAETDLEVFIQKCEKETHRLTIYISTQFMFPFTTVFVTWLLTALSEL